MLAVLLRAVLCVMPALDRVFVLGYGYRVFCFGVGWRGMRLVGVVWKCMCFLWKCFAFGWRKEESYFGKVNIHHHRSEN